MAARRHADTVASFNAAAAQCASQTRATGEPFALLPAVATGTPLQFMLVPSGLTVSIDDKKTKLSGALKAKLTRLTHGDRVVLRVVGVDLNEMKLDVEFAGDSGFDATTRHGS